MSTPPSNQAEKKVNNFPYKTLLWVIFAIIVIFVFKDPLIKILESAEEVTIWDKVKIKVSKADVKKLEEAQKDYELKIKDLNSMVNVQNETIVALTSIKEQLEKDIENCPEAEGSTEAFNNEFAKVQATNRKIQSYSDILQESTLLKVEGFAPERRFN